MVCSIFTVIYIIKVKKSDHFPCLIISLTTHVNSFGTVCLFSDTHIGLKEVYIGGTQPSTKIVRNLPSIQNFCVTKTRSAKRLKDISNT